MWSAPVMTYPQAYCSCVFPGDVCSGAVMVEYKFKNETEIHSCTAPSPASSKFWRGYIVLDMSNTSKRIDSVRICWLDMKGEYAGEKQLSPWSDWITPAVVN